jgi:hypothetical protein
VYLDLLEPSRQQLMTDLIHCVNEMHKNHIDYPFQDFFDSFQVVDRGARKPGRRYACFLSRLSPDKFYKWDTLEPQGDWKCKHGDTMNLIAIHWEALEVCCSSYLFSTNLHPTSRLTSSIA